MSSDVRFSLLAILFLSCTFNVHAHPSRFSEDDNTSVEEFVNPWSLDDLSEGSEHDANRDEALEKLQQVRLQIIVSYNLLFVRLGENGTLISGTIRNKSETTK